MPISSVRLCRLLALAWALTVVAGALACAGTGSDPDAGVEDDPDLEACEHMADGPAVDVTAAASVTEAPSVSTAHTRFDVTLLDDGAGMYTGSVTYEADEAGDHAVYLDADLPLTVYDVAGAELPVEGSDPVSACAEVAIKKTVELPVGTVELRLGPSSASEVSLVVEGAAHDEEGE